MSEVIRLLVEGVTPPNRPAGRFGRLDGATLTTLLDAARTAPSGVNGQTWRFVVVTDPARLARLVDAVPAFAGAVTGASALLAVCGARGASAQARAAGRTSRKDLGIPFTAIDVPNALVHLLLAGTELGIPYAWTLDVDEDHVRDELRIPADVRVVALVVL